MCLTINNAYVSKNGSSLGVLCRNMARDQLLSTFEGHIFVNRHQDGITREYNITDIVLLFTGELVEEANPQKCQLPKLG